MAQTQPVIAVIRGERGGRHRLIVGKIAAAPQRADDGTGLPRPLEVVASVSSGSMQDRADDGHDDDPAPVPGPDPARTWVHPSEVGLGRRDRTDRRRGAVLAGGLVVGGVGLLVAGVLMGLGWESAEPREEATAVASMTPSIASLTIEATDGRRTAATGVVLDGDGHVAVRASALPAGSTVWAACGGRAPERVTVHAVDEPSDVAVLSLPTPSGRAVATGDDPRLGQDVVVVQAAAGEEMPSWWTSTVTDAGVDLARANGSVGLDLFRMAAPTSNAADGAVFDRRGRFLGLVLEASDGSQNALPGHEVVDVARDLVDDRRVDRSWLGIETKDLSRDLGTMLGVTGGATVVSVDPGGPADLAGLRVGDVVVAVGDTQVNRMVDLAAALRRLRPGSATQATVLRDGVRQVLPVTTAARPVAAAVSALAPG